MNIKLYHTKSRVFPDFIDIGGVKFPIDADFRNILKILAMMKDRNVPDMQKVYKMREWFVGESNESDDSIEGSETADIFDAAKAFGKFLRCDNGLNDGGVNQGQNSQNMQNSQNETNAVAETDEPQFCYEFDACEIYAGFLSEYNIDLIECGFLHWYKFRILLDNLSETSAFKRKIALRFIDLSEFSREQSGFSDIVKAWQSVQLPILYSNEEMQEIREFEEFWERV